MLKFKIAFTLLAPIALLTALLTGADHASAASADTGDDDPVALQPGSEPVYANDWSIAIAPDASPSKGAVTQATYGGCYGNFTSVVSVPAEHEFQWGSELSCTKSVVGQTGIHIQYCTRDGGPDDFDCSTVASNGGSRTAQAYHSAYTYAACRGSAHFRPIAYNIEVSNVYYPDVIGNVNTINCAAG